MASPTKRTWNRRNARDAKLLKKRQRRLRITAKKAVANKTVTKKAVEKKAPATAKKS